MWIGVSIAAVWGLGVVGQLFHRRHTRIHHPHRWAQRRMGWLSFSDREQLLMIWFWPITLAATVLILLVAWIQNRVF